MKLTKQNICVFIENESQLNEVRNLMGKYNQDFDESEDLFKILEKYKWFYLQLYGKNSWFFSLKTLGVNQITLSELETILKNEAK